MTIDLGVVILNSIVSAFFLSFLTPKNRLFSPLSLPSKICQRQFVPGLLSPLVIHDISATQKMFDFKLSSCVHEVVIKPTRKVFLPWTNFFLQGFRRHCRPSSFLRAILSNKHPSLPLHHRHITPFSLHAPTLLTCIQRLLVNQKSTLTHFTVFFASVLGVQAPAPSQGGIIVWH